ncbi:hypothetical protein LPE509_02825 [Legionella pneumophila subsp. pneumophila LPE509]|nr:hypothetical protein LPE509_02825 [Legionella pneumophila subsp. pneumophila LPE509]
MILKFFINSHKNTSIKNTLSLFFNVYFQQAFISSFYLLIKKQFAYFS